MKINKNEGKIRFKLFGENRVREAIGKTPSHSVFGLQRVLKKKSITQAEIQLCNSIIGGC